MSIVSLSLSEQSSIDNNKAQEPSSTENAEIENFLRRTIGEYLNTGNLPTQLSERSFDVRPQNNSSHDLYSMRHAHHSKKSRHYSKDKKDKKSSKNIDLNEDFIKSYNSNIGNKENQEAALKLLSDMRKMGRLTDKEVQTTSVSFARIGFARLVRINNKEIQLAALRDLQYLIINDPVSKKSSEGFVLLMIEILKTTNRDHFQSATLEVQTELAKTYGLIAKLGLLHLEKQNINGITHELKEALVESAKSLAKLNRIDNPELSFYAEFALQGILRLKDDNSDLIDALRRLFHLSMAAASYFLDGINPAEELKKAFFGIKIDRKNLWYNSAMMLDVLSPKANSSPKNLLCMLELITKEAPNHDWRFLFYALNILSDTVLYGSSEDIRMLAFSGVPLASGALPGLAYYTVFNGFSKKIDFSKLSHIELPEKKDPNDFIRFQTWKLLLEIKESSQDISIKKLINEMLERPENREIAARLKISLNSSSGSWEIVPCYFESDSEEETVAEKPRRYSGNVSKRHSLSPGDLSSKFSPEVPSRLSDPAFFKTHSLTSTESLDYKDLKRKKRSKKSHSDPRNASVANLYRRHSMEIPKEITEKISKRGEKK